eukprot:CAMPEP_0203637086 /NCGR_PEP_ID=MMETSP0088-20131115/3479_1 /ASSEMBLY_ACC=CAM_ASM_001087 /TAXON_ID=426623 /ORGANISM="Chaetoceros affinis, Strain CCMP159" /LENGTH=245 /DNA_ID=CAMNT_0050491393 /DNA_START=122 /DNA_END=859 /DNA_ORIENTATION=-
MPGTYHFRFKSPLIPGSDREKNAISVWMDCVDDDQHVGVWRNTIVAKVTRINMDDDDDDDEDFARHRNGSSHHVNVNTAPAPAPTRRAPSQQSSPRQSTSRPAPPPPPAPIPASPPNLLGFDDPVPASTSAAAAPPSNGSLLDDNHLNGNSHGPTGESLLNLNDTSGYNTNLQHQSSHDDFLGMTSTPITTATPAPAPVAPAPSSYGMSGMPQQRANSGNGTPGKPNKAFDTFANQSGPFGGLKW